MAHIMTCLNIVYTRTLSCPELLKKNDCTTYCNKKHDYMYICIEIHPRDHLKKKKESSVAEDSHGLNIC